MKKHHQPTKKMRRAARRQARQQVKTMTTHVDAMIDAYLSEECTLAGVASGMGLAEEDALAYIILDGDDVCDRCKFIVPANEIVEIPLEGFCHSVTYRRLCTTCSGMIVTE